MTSSKQEYDYAKIEEKWKKAWYSVNLYKAEDFSQKPKKYILAELPYPSGKSLHIGHAMRYTVPDVYSRYLRMQGYNVLFPMGWDSFGLPTEGFALKENKTPQEVTEQLKVDYKNAMQNMGYAIDWDREFATSDPSTYKWTQWLFLKFYEHGLAKLTEMPVWWCKELGNLADEEVLTDKDGNKISERGGYKVEKKLFKQWVLKIPEYAEKLLDGLEKTDFPEHIKNAQINWIGKTVGANVVFELCSLDKSYTQNIEVYTTRPDTIFGVTFLVLSAEHPLVEELINKVTNKAEVVKYVNYAKNLSDMDRQKLKEKTGIKLQGIFAKHPFGTVTTQIPVYVGNYVLMDVGTGVVMGVPAHDERDFEFAKKYTLEVIPVVKSAEDKNKVIREILPFVEYGEMFNSGEFDGLSSQEGLEKIIEALEKLGKGKRATNYKIRDWVFSRQHYWGEPIPLVYKESGEVEAVVETTNMEEVHKKLPVELPYSTEYTPTEDGQPPLARIPDWVNTVDSKGKPAKRETQTMPTWAGSSWYYLRYLDPQNQEEFANFEKLKYWLPVDKYFGGAEHTTVHLLYSRFWHRFFYDIGLVPTEEPYQWRMNGGLLLASDGRKMSKRFGNVVEPQLLVDNYGADATRMALCFLGPYTETYPWNDNIIRSTWRLLNTIYGLKEKISEEKTDPSMEKLLHKTIKNVTEMLENIKMNTAISQIMILTNELKAQKTINKDVWADFIKLLAPLAPFLAEELWQEHNGWKEWDPKNSVHLTKWPTFDPNLAQDEKVFLGIQINGKIRDEIELEKDSPESLVKELVLKRENVCKYIQGKEIKKFIYVPGKIISLVV
ncbi:leucine--tRNA ligase [Patescibacteria group bacterium]|nr:leucine--tRNA ligase [Patescibacteria group bacterium]